MKQTHDYCCSRLFVYVQPLLSEEKAYFQAIYRLRVSDQNGVSLLYIMLEIHHSGQEPSRLDICSNNRIVFDLDKAPAEQKAHVK